MKFNESGEDDTVSGDAFHPLGEDWEDELEAMLEETEYDTELGMEMGRDAMRLTAGELTEEEFYDRYHERVVEEFDVDDRPMADEIEEAREEGRFADALARLEGEDDESRRELLQKMGAGAGFFGLGAWATVDDRSDDDTFAAAQEDDDEDDDEGIQWGMALDLETCDGCLSCVVACNQEHNWDQGANWMYVLAYDDDTSESPDLDEYDDVREFNYLIRPCQHCTDAPCEKVCPTTARHTRERDGLVLTDYDVCIGCRYCQVACPYGVNYFQWSEPDVPAEDLVPEMVYDERGRPVASRGPRGVMEKCVFDPTRQDGQMGEDLVGTTACEIACPPGAIQFGDMNDPDSDPRQYLDDVSLARAKEADPDDDDLQEAIAILDGEEEPAEDEDDDGMTEDEATRLLQGEYGTGDSTFRLLEDYGTNPNVVYIGDEPGANAEQVPGPVAYDDVGMTDDRKDVLDDGTVGGL